MENRGFIGRPRRTRHLVSEVIEAARVKRLEDDAADKAEPHHSSDEGRPEHGSAGLQREQSNAETLPPSGLGIGGVMMAVVSKVAPLTHGPQVVIGAVLRNVVEVRGREDHQRTSEGVGLSVESRAAPLVSALALPFTFAAPRRPIDPDAATNGLPVGRITSAVLRSDRHGSAALPPVIGERYVYADGVLMDRADKRE